MPTHNIVCQHDLEQLKLTQYRLLLLCLGGILLDIFLFNFGGLRSKLSKENFFTLWGEINPFALSPSSA